MEVTQGYITMPVENVLSTMGPSCSDVKSAKGLVGGKQKALKVLQVTSKVRLSWAVTVTPCDFVRQLGIDLKSFQL